MRTAPLTRVVATLAFMATASFAADQLPSPNPPALGPDPRMTLVQDDYLISGPLSQCTPTIDLSGGGWLVTNALSQPQCLQGRLIAGSTESTGKIELPTLSPCGEITIDTDLEFHHTTSSIRLGFLRSASPSNSEKIGPWVKVTGAGEAHLHQDASTNLQSAAFAAINATFKPFHLTMRHNLLNGTISISINGEEIIHKVIPKNDFICNNFFMEFLSSEIGDPSYIEHLTIRYLPIPNPPQITPHETVIVQDTSISGITKAIKSANKQTRPDHIIEISIPKGNYHFNKKDGPSDENSHIFWTFGLKNMIINWNGSTIILDDPRQGLQNFSASKNVTIKNISEIDYPDNNLPFTQGTIVNFNRKEDYLDVKIDENFPLPDSAFFSSSRKGESWGQLIDAAIPGKRKSGAPMELWIKETQKLSNDTYRFYMRSPIPQIGIGDRFTDNPRVHGESIFRIFDAENITLENITGYSCGGFWSIVYNNKYLTYRNVRVLIKRGRLMSGNADIATGVGNQFLWMENCEFEGNADDMVHQFNGKYIYITNSKFKNNRRFGIWLNTTEHATINHCQFSGIGSHAISAMKEPDMGEEQKFSSRHILCLHNTINNSINGGIGLEAMNSKPLPNDLWNSDWIIANNAIDSWISIRNATNIKLSNNTKLGSQDDAIVRIDKPSTSACTGFQSLDLSPKVQSITFSEPGNKSLTSQDFIPEASASSGLPLTFISSDASVATIVNGKIHIVGPGITTITALQDGNDTWAAAAPMSHKLIIRKSQNSERP